MVTSKDYAQDRNVARDLGAREFLLKPLRSREIRALIEQYTGAELRALPAPRPSPPICARAAIPPASRSAVATTS